LVGGTGVVLAKRYATAVTDAVVAERELEDTKRECEEMLVRVTRARQGGFETTQGHLVPARYGLTTPLTPARPSAGRRESVPNEQRIAGATKTPLNRPTAKHKDHLASQGPPTPSDPPPKERSPPHAQADSQKDTGNDQSVENGLSDESLGLLVQRYAGLCRERQTLQREIEDWLKRKERLAAEKLRQAIKAMADLNEASGGDPRIRLPSSVTPASSSGLVPKIAHNPCSLPLDSPSAATGAVGLVLPSPKTPRSAAIDQLGNLTSKLLHMPVARPLGSKEVPKVGVYEPGSGAMGIAQQNVSQYCPPHLRKPNGVDSPHSLDFSRGLSNNGSVYDPPGTWSSAYSSPRMGPPPSPYQPIPPPQNMPIASNRLVNGAVVGFPHVSGPVSQPVPGRAPLWMPTQPTQPTQPIGRHAYVSRVYDTPVLD
jgi:hypothetical protein